MIDFFSYCITKMSFSSSPKGTPHERCRRTMKKKQFAMKITGISWCSQKNGSRSTIFIGDLYSMYVVLQGIGSLPCKSIRVYIYVYIYIIYVIPLGEQHPCWMSEVPKLERFNKKQLRNDQFLFILLKKMSFSSSPKGTPHDRRRRTMKKKYFAM